MAETDEYPPWARFAWDMIEMSPAELDEMADYADAGELDNVEAVINRAEERLFKVA